MQGHWGQAHRVARPSPVVRGSRGSPGSNSLMLRMQRRLPVEDFTYWAWIWETAEPGLTPDFRLEIAIAHSVQ
jgi:hypothetical protein